MSETLQNDNEVIALIRDTLRERDPYQKCVVLGSAAIVAHFFDADIPSPVGCSDVDVLCSTDFFNQELMNLNGRFGVSKVQVRWPKGRLALRGARNLSLDIYPEAGEALLPFTAATDMSDAWLSETYNNALQVAVQKAGIICKPLDDILLQIARIGRDKDIDNVMRILPVAKGTLLDADQVQAVLDELDVTLVERERHPERYYARVEI